MTSVGNLFCNPLGQEFFFSSRRRHTRFLRDWSSHVCSSDLTPRSTPRTPGPQTVKLKVGDSPMKVFPMGARILPKTASVGGSTPASGGSPVFMVATSSMSQNLMRVARTTNQTVTFTSGQRVVTVNTSGSSKAPGTAAVVGGVTLKPGATPTTIKALQPRVVTSVNPGGHPKSNLPPSAASSKPSVIVVQRSGNNSGSATAITAKALVTKVR